MEKDKKVVSEIANEIPMDQHEKLSMHSYLCDELKELYRTKNMDYGDSMHPLFEEFGLDAFIILLQIKLQRIKTLNRRSGHYESLQDSLRDLANYALIALTELEYKAGNTKSGDM